MLIDRLSASFSRSGAYSTVTELLSRGDDASLAVPGLVRPALVATIFRAQPRPVFVAVAGAESAERFWRQTASFLGRENVLLLPDRSDLPWSVVAPDVAEVGARARALHALETNRPVVVVAAARALLRSVPPQGSHNVYRPLALAAGTTLDLEKAAATLSRMGYIRLDSADEPGTFAIRGGVLDVFGAGSQHPVRAELYGDDLESLKRYVPGTGQTIGDAGPTEIYPCRELVLSARGAESAERALRDHALKDQLLALELEKLREGIPFNGVERYLPLLYKRAAAPTEYLGSEVLVVVAEPRSLFDDTVRRREELETAAKAVNYRSVAPGKAPLDGLYLTPAQIDFGERQRLTLLSMLRAGSGVDAELIARRPEVSGGEDKFIGGVRSLLSAGFAVALAVPDRRTRRRVGDLLVEAGVGITEERDVEADGALDHLSALEEGKVDIVDVEVPSGFVVPDARVAVISIDDVYPRSMVRRRRREIDPTRVTFSFAPGDYVVHATHGIALFREVIRQEVMGAERDYLLLEYAKGDKLFVPVEQIDRITKFVGPDGGAPRITRLNTADWSKATGKARKAARLLAFDLVDLYARRSTVTGHSYTEDTPWQIEMEAMFPYVETPDQLAAIADVKADMESDKPMDRLVCGDVGYGKTEVAIRAAFKAASDGKQVMVLCPTTILAQQHYTNFTERFAPFGVKVEVMSRFRTDSQQKGALEGFMSGEVAVLVGTHRLLSRDVAPKDLGLVIIDEEQRFGVEHKEQLKNLREQVDILTLSATPIPRTLQMSLSGVRDMSIIDTPPPNRFPVNVHVGEWDEDVVSAAVRRELERGGQIYYVSNRVKTIDDAVQRVRDAAPEARIAVAHGQMSEKQLEAVMEQFAANEADVLVATTIIESGIDNPHSNTLIIEDSQRLGLAQLYQLKGRVGRSHVKAYAYFLFPRTAALTETAIERLTAIKENDELGSGIKIAMRDLEIRGAGSLIGAEQSGNLSAVGFDLFAAMLMEAVAEARGEPVVAHPDIRVDLPLAAFIPAEYLEDVDERVRFYRRLAGSPTLEAVDAVAAELRDKHGALPEPARNLVDIARIKALAADGSITSVALVRRRLVFSPVDLSDEKRGRMAALGAVFLDRKKELALPIEYGESVAHKALDTLSAIYSRQSVPSSQEE
ncbi:MAG: transcription-repair coupling factor [Actinobacteria bacterium HGW-Actinobacteria-7]|nr:MAG: transcription-repair coupling factor [Actinobacteria bacterium HGW-Actinobacteria-7]